MATFRLPHRPALKIFAQTQGWLALLALLPGVTYGFTHGLAKGVLAFLVCFLVPLPFMVYAFWGALYPKRSHDSAGA